MTNPDPNRRFTITLYNEKHSRVRGFNAGAWNSLLRRGTVAVSGYGHFAEIATPDGFLAYNTSLQGTGDQYPDPNSEFLAGQNNYLLLTFDRHPARLRIQIKNLDGKRLHETTIEE